MLGGRYRLIAAIGMGSSAQVFLADDVRLRRRVAVKVLHTALANDQDFLRRFRSEIQAAAALRHPHLLAIHDWNDDDVPYVVTEFLGGGSLRGLLDRGGRLTPSQALQVGLSAARGLDFAHARGLVHRGLKPANVLFGDDARLRLGDFGLARALAEAASTEPQGTVLGTARYASPEQVQGHSLDGRADVYALALMLVEAVTGRVPFSADTTIGTLMARVDAPLPLPAELGPLAAPLARAGHPELEERLDAGGLVTALMAVAEALPAPDPLPLAGALDDDVVVAEGADATRVVVGPLAPRTEHDDITYAGVPAGGPDGGSAEPIVVLPPMEAAPPGGDVARPAGGSGPAAVPGAPAGSVAAPASSVPAEVAPSEVPDAVATEGGGRAHRDAPGAHPGRRAKVAWTTLGILVVLAVAAAGVLAVLAARTPTHQIPAVVGGQEAAVVAQLRELGFVPQVSRERKDGTAVGQVLATRPAPGESLAEGRPITVVVSEGATLVPLPTDLTGRPQADAEAALRALGLFLQPPEAVWSESIPAGAVVGYAEGTPTELARGMTVTLVVSQGPQPRQIPSIDGLGVDGAVDALEKLGLVAQKVEVFSDTVDKGGLVGLDPAPGATVPRGATVSVQVSKGPELVEVPSLSGARSIDDAVRLLEAAGLQAGHAQGRLSGRPREFDPGAGTKVPKGSSVDIILR